MQFEKVLVVGLPERSDRRDSIALALDASRVHYEFVNGVHGEDVPKKALPPKANPGLRPTNIGSWRAHVNALARIVRQNLSSALIMEDDMDWDVHIKLRLQEFGRSNHALTVVPGSDSLKFADMPSVDPPFTSPYGDGWDLLWLGHCGADPPSDGRLMVHHDDPSVPPPKYVRNFQQKNPISDYPPHTRIVARPRLAGPVCSMAYAVSWQGARRLYHAMALESLDAAYDLMLSRWCSGHPPYTGGPRICPGVIPPLFEHWRPRGPLSGDSDIADPSEGFREKSETMNVRWSTRMNLEQLWKGTTEFEDQFPEQ